MATQPQLSFPPSPLQIRVEKFQRNSARYGQRAALLMDLANVVANQAPSTPRVRRNPVFVLKATR